MKAVTPCILATFFAIFAYAEPDSSAQGNEEFEIAKTELASNDKVALISARERLLRVIAEPENRRLLQEAYLYLGRVSVKLEQWEEGRVYFGKMNKFKKPNLKFRAESNFLYGLCLEKLGRGDDAIKVYNAVIAVYGSNVIWSSQALERGFELAYQDTNPENRLKAYRYLRKVLWMYDGYTEEDTSSGALTRLRSRLPVIKDALGMSPEQFQEIDAGLGITWTHLSVEGEDATSQHYYFYHIDMGVRDRLRWIWNGGAQNLPTVVDYVLDSGKITVRHLFGSRDSIPELISGGVTALELKGEYSIDSQYSVEERRLVDTKKTLSEKQRDDLKTLADLLTRERKEINAKAE